MKNGGFIFSLGELGSKSLAGIAVKEVTPQDDPEITEELRGYSERRPPFRFSLAKIPVGAELQFVRDESISCRVIDERHVNFNGEETSLSAAASDLLRQKGWKSTQVQGPTYWLYDGETLEERRQRIEAEG